MCFQIGRPNIWCTCCVIICDSFQIICDMIVVGADSLKIFSNSFSNCSLHSVYTIFYKCLLSTIYKIDQILFLYN